MNTLHEFVYLASQSPRRAELLDQIGVRHHPLLASEDENIEALEAERTGEVPAAYVQRVTRAKLRAAKLRLTQRGLRVAPILCADTTVALGRRILGKPCDASAASATLTLLAGQTHRVITAVTATVGQRCELAVSISHVRFGAISHAQIERYVASGEPFGKAGAYAVQGAAAAWIEHIEGSYSGIMGLPLYQTAQLLQAARVQF
jgi:septum formation protein